MPFITFGTDRAKAARTNIGAPPTTFDPGWSWKKYDQDVAKANVEMIEGDFSGGLGQGIGIAVGIVGISYLVGKMMGK